MKIDGYSIGVNFGLPSKLDDSTIQEDDLKRIAAWNMDHIRVNMSHPVLIDESDNSFRDDGFVILDSIVEWAERHGLNVIMDLHTCPGYHFMYDENWPERGTNTLLTDRATQDNFIDIWRFFAHRYAAHEGTVAFELLNEVVFDPENRWNKIVHRTVKEIRSINPNRVIVYGGKYYNNINFLKDLDVFGDDDRIIYTYHFYLPSFITHQNASWHRQMMIYKEEVGEVVQYPGPIPKVKEFLDNHPEYKEFEDRYIGVTLDRDFMWNVDCRPAVEFLESHDVSLYCGEFGCYSQCPRTTRVNYLRDLIGFLRHWDIGMGYFNYKGDGFGLVASDGTEDKELLKILLDA